MRKTFELPTEITVRNIRQAAKNATIRSAREWETALILAKSGGRTAQDIANASGLSRAWIFRRKSLLNRPDGLERSFQRKYGGGTTSRIDPATRKEMKIRFKRGHSASEVQEWLSTKSNPVEMTINGVYYYRRNLGFARPQPPRKRRGNKPTRPRENILCCSLDESTRNRIEYLLHKEHDFGLPSRARRTLEVLRELGKRTQAILELKGRIQSESIGHALPARKIVKNISCSPKTYYRVARLFRQAKGDWNGFIKLAFSKGAQVEINRHVNAMLKSC